MRTILSVIGPHSGCGKTLFITHLLRHVPGLGCLKVRPGHDWPERHPVRGEPIEKDFYLEESASLHDSGADTALYLEAGAAQVEILRHRGDGLAPGLGVALDRFPPAMPVVVESSSAVPLLSPVAVILIVRPPLREMKPSTAATLSRVTDLLINAASQDDLFTGTGMRGSASLSGTGFPANGPCGTGFPAGLSRKEIGFEMICQRLRQQYPSLRPRFTWSTDSLAEQLPDGMPARLRGMLTTR